jgi:ring-1,2-phenylacetyl-CoA epoxidase subunit PaaD
LRAAVAAVPDPEVPVLSIEDLGVLRSVEQEGERVVVTITPTYSGCPAMHHIETEIAGVLAAAGVDGEVRTVLEPAWTTDWMTESGRSKLRRYGIAPPGPAAASTPGAGVPVTIRRAVRCPRCDSPATEVVSEFGSTACKALYRCRDCLEPFDYFKEL